MSFKWLFEDTRRSRSVTSIDSETLTNSEEPDRMLQTRNTSSCFARYAFKDLNSFIFHDLHYLYGNNAFDRR